jgi:hypothetical protein
MATAATEPFRHDIIDYYNVLLTQENFWKSNKKGSLKHGLFSKFGRHAIADQEWENSDLSKFLSSPAELFMRLGMFFFSGF